MRHIKGVLSLIQIYIASLIGIFCFSNFVGIIAARIGLYSCLPQTEKFNFYSLIWLGLGLLLISLIVKDIISPKIKKISLANYDEYDFCSTHPSYVLLDVLLIPPFYLIYLITANDARCTFLQEHTRGSFVLILAIALPLFRLFCWYILRRQLLNEFIRRNAPKLLIPLYLIVTPIFIILAVLYAQMFILPRMNGPIVDSKTLAGGLIKHPEFAGKVVHLKGIQNSEPFECNKFNGEFACATVLVDLAEGGEVLVKVCGARQQDLFKQTKGNIGKPFETFGEIISIDAKQKDLCGIETLGTPPLAGRLLLEVDYP